MKIAVIGGGMIGSFIAKELCNDFEVTVIDNNNLVKSIKIESESKSGLIPYPSVGTIIATIGIVSYLSRRKAN